MFTHFSDACVYEFNCDVTFDLLLYNISCCVFDLMLLYVCTDFMNCFNFALYSLERPVREPKKFTSILNNN